MARRRRGSCDPVDVGFAHAASWRASRASWSRGAYVSVRRARWVRGYGGGPRAVLGRWGRSATPHAARVSAAPLPDVPEGGALPRATMPSTPQDLNSPLLDSQHHI